MYAAKNHFTKQVQKLGISSNVTFLGFVSEDELIALYNNAQVMLYPSLYEGFGIPILEAMACKCCVLSSKTSGGMKIVGKNNGMLFDIGDKLELAEKLKKLMRDQLLREELALQSYENAKQYEIEGISKLWDQVFE